MLGQRWCVQCAENVRRVHPPFCEICGQRHTRGNICRRCAEKTPRCAAIRAWAEFEGPVREALHRLKYRRDLGLGDVLSLGMVAVCRREGWPIDLVVPVPLGAGRKRERGYNQAALLAKPLAYRLNLPYRPQALSRLRETRSQVELSREERLVNVVGAFKARSGLVKGKHVLVVDDVTTTGATLEACADSLLHAGAVSVFGLTLARAG